MISAFLYHDAHGQGSADEVESLLEASWDQARCSFPPSPSPFGKPPLVLQVGYHPLHSNLHQRSLRPDFRRLSGTPGNKIRLPHIGPRTIHRLKLLGFQLIAASHPQELSGRVPASYSHLYFQSLQWAGETGIAIN